MDFMRPLTPPHPGHFTPPPLPSGPFFFRTGAVKSTWSPFVLHYVRPAFFVFFRMFRRPCLSYPRGQPGSSFPAEGPWSPPRFARVPSYIIFSPCLFLRHTSSQPAVHERKLRFAFGLFRVACPGLSRPRVTWRFDFQPSPPIFAPWRPARVVDLSPSSAPPPARTLLIRHPPCANGFRNVMIALFSVLAVSSP